MCLKKKSIFFCRFWIECGFKCNSASRTNTKEKEIKVGFWRRRTCRKRIRHFRLQFNPNISNCHLELNVASIFTLIPHNLKALDVSYLTFCLNRRKLSIRNEKMPQSWYNVSFSLRNPLLKCHPLSLLKTKRKLYFAKNF